MTNTNHVEFVSIEKLELDIENPRIRKWVEMYGDKPTPEQLYLALGAGSVDPESGTTTTFNSLKQSIQTNKGIIQPIIVNRHTDGRMVVIEGNTRVAIYREFKENKVPGNWEIIFAIVHENLGSSGINAIRLQAHLVGPRPWDPYSKAKYLHSLRDQEDLPLAEIVDYCGGKRREVMEYIDAYIDMEKHYRAVISDDSSFDTTRFSAFVELQKPGIKQAIFMAGHNLDDFARWVDERLIDPLNTVRALPQILANLEAREVFLKDGAKEAKKVLDIPTSPAVDTLSLEQLLRGVISRINQIQYHEVKRLKANPSSPASQLITEAKDSITELYNDITVEE
jgi:ParB-like nuclease domain